MLDRICNADLREACRFFGQGVTMPVTPYSDLRQSKTRSQGVALVESGMCRARLMQ